MQAVLRMSARNRVGRLTVPAKYIHPTPVESDLGFHGRVEKYWIKPADIDEIRSMCRKSVAFHHGTFFPEDIKAHFYDEHDYALFKLLWA